MRTPQSREQTIGIVFVLALISIACALMQQPTPIVLPTPSATVEPGPPIEPASTATQTPDVLQTDTPAPPTATAEPPTATATPTATLEPPTDTPQPPVGIRVLFEPGATDTTISGQLTGATTRTYILGIAAGQLVDISAPTAQHLTLTIRGADGTLIKPEGQPFFRDVVPSSQDYLLTLSSGNATETYQVNIIIPVRITFDPGAIAARLQTTIPADGTRHYVIRALAGQTMTVDTTTTQGQILTIVYGVDGTVLQTDHAGASDFTGPLPFTQDYLIDLRAVFGQPATVTIDVTIPPPE